MQVQLPDLGEGTKEATVKELYVKPGMKVEEFDDLVEVYTDKLVAKIPSNFDGIVKEINYNVDDVCLVGHALMTIEVEDDGSSPDVEDSSSTSSSSSSEEAETKPTERLIEHHIKYN